MLNERLKVARKKAGLSLRGLQEKIANKVSAQAIGKYERGIMKPSKEVLSTLADALNVTVGFLTASSDIRLGAIEFRENFIRNKRDDNIVRAKILSHVERSLEIEEILQVETLEWTLPRSFPYPIRDNNDIEEATQLLRTVWNLGYDAIPNLTELLENRGIKVIYLNLPESVSGVSCFIERSGHGRIPVIVVNKQITPERQRFTLAHELGHLLLDVIDENKEDICDRFASSLLMPKQILWETLGRHRQSISIAELISLKKMFGVSILAIVVRCSKINLIRSQTYQNIYKEFIDRGWTKPPFDEPEKLEVEESKRFERLCYRAVAEGLVHVERVADWLDKTPEEVNKQMAYI